MDLLYGLLGDRRAESSILGLVEIVGGVAIAAAVRKIADSIGRYAPQIGHGSQLPPARVTCSKTLLSAWQPWIVTPSSTRPWEVIGFEELLSELIARVRMLCPHLGSRLASLLLTYGVRWRTLSCEERCGRMIANPVKSTCTSTTPQLSERAGADACL